MTRILAANKLQSGMRMVSFAHDKGRSYYYAHVKRVIPILVNKIYGQRTESPFLVVARVTNPSEILSAIATNSVINV